ncbi:hypothetical protein BDR05DRAFT_999509 [Suillus weaverae]|nr:hypothetical protein BDR05DRAFT_999509 [Suillus weaverae]
MAPPVMSSPAASPHPHVGPVQQHISADQVLTLLQNPWLSSLVASQPTAAHASSGLLSSLLPASLLPAPAPSFKARVHSLPPSDPSMQLDPNDLIDHGLVVHIFKEGWQSYFPINSLSADLTHVTLHYAKAPTEFDLANEPSISYPNFCEAACMLPVLIGRHLNSPFKAEIAESFWKHYKGVLRAHNFQHNFTAYVHYNIMIHQHWVNNLLDFNLAIFQPHIFSHCLGLVKAEADSSMASHIASLEAQVNQGNSFRTPTKPSSSLPSTEKPVKAPSELVGICWFCTGKHSPCDCKSSSNSFITKHTDRKWHSATNELLCFLFNGVKGCAKRPCAHSPTSALSVAKSQQAIMPSLTHWLDLLPIVTPLQWDKWEELLGAAGVLNSFHNVPLGLCNGFHLGVSSSILSTFSPPNHNLALEHADFIDSQIKRRSPQDDILQKSTPTPSGVIGGPSLSAIFLLPSPLWARRLPFSMWTQPTATCLWPQRTAATYAFHGRARSMRTIVAASAVPAHREFSDIIKWADDFLFFHYPSACLPSGSYIFSYNALLIWEIAIYLGWPWSPEKFRNFLALFVYIGFKWDLVAKSVCIPKEKKKKYLVHLEGWVSGASVSAHECAVMTGTLNHCAAAVIAGCSHLASLYHFAL